MTFAIYLIFQTGSRICTQTSSFVAIYILSVGWINKPKYKTYFHLTPRGLSDLHRACDTLINCWSPSLSCLWRPSCWSQSWLWLPCPPRPTTATAPWPAPRVQATIRRRKRIARKATPRPMRLSSKTPQIPTAPAHSWTAPWASSNTKSPTLIPRVLHLGLLNAAVLHFCFWPQTPT